MNIGPLDRRIAIEYVRCDFYVYAHRRLGSGVPFYVGKGCRRRAAKAIGRNPHWKNIVAKDGGYLTAFIAKDIDEELAFLVEIEAIDVLRRRGAALVNMTDGGDGVSGLRHSDEYKRRMSEAMTGNTYGLWRIRPEEEKQRISASMKGKPSNTKGMKFTDAQLVNVRAFHEARRKPKSPRGPDKRFGRIWTEEQRDAQRHRTIGKKASAETRRKMSESQKLRYAKQ